MQTMVLSPQVQSADVPTASATLSSRHKLAGFLAGAGALLLPVTMSLPWYRAADGGQTFSAWDGYRFVAAEMVLLAVAGAWLALRLLAGTPVRETALRVIIGVAFAVTISMVVALFIARPGGNHATALAFGGYAAFLAINAIKGSAILMTIKARRRAASSPVSA